MSASLSRATGRNARLNSETSLEPSDEWIAALRKSIENELRPQLEDAERVRDENLRMAGDADEARQKILEEYNNTKATYITIAQLTFTERLEEEKRRRKGRDPGTVSEDQPGQSPVSQRPRRTAQAERSTFDVALPFADGGSIDPAVGPDDDPYPSPGTSQDYTIRPSQPQSLSSRRYEGTFDNSSATGATLPRHIPSSRRESLDTFDTEPEDSEPGSYNGYAGVSRRQSSGSMNSMRAKFWQGPQVSPKDAPISRSSDFAPSPSTSAPRRGMAGPSNGSGISTAFTHSPTQPPSQAVHPPVRRDSNASLASSRSGGPGSVPRTSSMVPSFARNAISPAAAAVPVYTPPPQGPYGYSPSKKEISTDYYAAIPIATSSHSPRPPNSISTSSDAKQPEYPDDEAPLSRPSPDVDNAVTGKSWSARSTMQRPVRHRTSSTDFHARRLATDTRPGSSAASSRPSPIAVPSSPEYARGPAQPPPSSYSASQMRRFDDEQQNALSSSTAVTTTTTTSASAGIPIPSSSDRTITAPQASPEYSRSSFGSQRAMMRRKTSFTADQHFYHYPHHHHSNSNGGHQQHQQRNASQSPESARVAYPVRRNSVSSHHSGKSAKSYNGYPDHYYYANGSGVVYANANGNSVGNEGRSPMEPYAEQSHDGSASEHSDVGEEFDEQDFYEEMMLREEDMERREEELRLKVEEARRKEEEVSRKEEEAKRKEEEAKRKEEEIKRKEAEAKRKEEEARKKELEIKRKEEQARRKEEEVKRKEEDARRKEDDARKKEEDARRMEQDARRTEDEARRMEEEVRRMEEEARRKEEEVRKKEEEMHRKAEEAERKEEDARRLEEEARRIEEEARLREEEAERKEEEIRKREEALRLKEEEFERMEQEARRLSDEAKRRAFELRLKEEEAVRREEEAKQMEEEAKRREEDARRREEDARRKEEDARRKEDDARRREEYARIRAEEAKSRADEVRQRAEDARVRAEEARVREDILRKREEEFKRKEDELRAREEELERREAETKRLEEEKRETEFLAEFARHERRRLDELIVEQQRIANELASQREARRQAEELAARLQAEEAEEAKLLAEQEELSRAEYLAQQEEARQADRLAKERREAELRLAEEQRNAEQLAEERRRAEAHAERAAEERSRAEERRRAELAEEERRRKETARQLEEEERRRKEIARLLEEQRYEEMRRRTEQMRRQDAFTGNTTRSGTPSTSASQAAFSGTSRQAPASSANSDRSSTASNASWATNSSWTSWASQGSSASSASTQSTAKAAPPRRTTSSSSYNPTEPSAPRRGAGEDDYVRWQERQEEHARRQAEAFRKEQERLERQRQAKAGQMLTKEAVAQIFDEHDRMWSRLTVIDSASWSNFPWPMLKKPSTPEELTTTAISSYVLNPYNPSDRPEKDRIKEHIRRWHPDRFETKLLPKVRSEEREKVKEGAGQVVRSLNELLTRSA